MGLTAFGCSVLHNNVLWPRSHVGLLRAACSRGAGSSTSLRSSKHNKSNSEPMLLRRLRRVAADAAATAPARAGPPRTPPGAGSRPPPGVGPPRQRRLTPGASWSRRVGTTGRARAPPVAAADNTPAATTTDDDDDIDKASRGTPPPRDGLRPKQSLGQNFLRDAGMARRIVDTFAASVDALRPGVGGVVEVGAGTGALTGLLLDRYPRLHAIDIDQRAVAYLRERMPELDVRHADVLAIDWARLASRYDGGSVAVIGNLPYNIVSQILFALFEAPAPAVRMAVVMMQKEVADRITAPIRTKPYGILSVVGQLYATPEILFAVPPTVFSPRPSVDSALVRFEFCPHPDLDVYNTTLTGGLRTVLRSAFQQRRKTLRNSLRILCDERNLELPHHWAPKRAEELSPPEFIQLARFIFAKDLETPVLADKALSRPDTVWREAGDSV